MLVRLRDKGAVEARRALPGAVWPPRSLPTQTAAVPALLLTLPDPTIIVIITVIMIKKSRYQVVNRKMGLLVRATLHGCKQLIKQSSPQGRQ